MARFIADEQGEPVAWRWRYVYDGKASPWRIRQTPVEPHPATSALAALEVQPLYAAVQS